MHGYWTSDNTSQNQFESKGKEAIMNVIKGADNFLLASMTNGLLILYLSCWQIYVRSVVCDSF